MNRFRNYLPDVVALLLFVVISFAYFMPAVIEGRILYQHDTSAGRGAGQEAFEYFERTGERTRWSNAVFSGMPTYQTSPSYKSTSALSAVMDGYHLWLPDGVWYVFVYLLGMYLLIRVLQSCGWLSSGSRWLDVGVAVFGGLAWAFSSYFFIIIAAGHIWKVWALAYIPPLIGGMVLCYRGRYLFGFVLTGLFTAFEVKANHVQMTYYFLFVIAFLLVAFFVMSLRAGRLVSFLRGTCVFLLGGLLGVLMNVSSLYHTWEYSKETMRGGSELAEGGSAGGASGGLDRDYITQWSYGVGETWSLLVPNVKGGASVPLGRNVAAMKAANPSYIPVYEQMGQYWGEQPMTSGPVYVGALVFMLFVLGLFVVKGPVKWALVGATLLSVVLSWGKNFMWLTDLFIDYVPMYAKFRTVASILVIAEFTIPVLGVMALWELLRARTAGELGVLRKRILLSFCVTGGACVLFALFPGLFFGDFVSSQELAAFTGWPAEQLNPLLENLREVRRGILRADCWRSLIVVLAGVVCLLLYAWRRMSARWMVFGLCVICLIDMWSVNKRYLNDGMFVERSVRDLPQRLTATDELILQDKSLDYRVLNLASNTFNENETSYYHKSIGGYHAAKLRRYQDLIERYIAPEMQVVMSAIAGAEGDMSRVAGDSLYPVLNMLNTRYVIMPLQGGQTVPIMNPYAYGNAWFVDSLVYVDGARAELDGLGGLDLRHGAVADVRFKEQLGSAVEQDTSSVVLLTAYEPNELRYVARSGRGGVVVFSEIYYPGWTATVDGEAVNVGRVDYVLRAINVDAGEHEIVLTFKPSSIRVTEGIAYAASGILLLVIALGIFLNVKRMKR